MKICVLASLATSLFNFRGPLLHALQQLGHEVLACAPEREPEVVGELYRLGVDYRSVPLDRTGVNPWTDLRTLLALMQVFRRETPDLLLSYTAKPVIYGSLAARWVGVPRACSMITGLGHGLKTGSGRQRSLRPMLRHLYRIALTRNRVVFFQNPDDASLFQESGMLPATTRKVILNGSGVDLERFPHVPPRDAAPVFLLIARLIREKGIEEYVQAAALVLARYPHVKFQLVGPCEKHPSALEKEKVFAWQQAGTIQYLGELADVRPALIASSVYVLPSYYGEGTPRTILEAMATGRAIITTDSPGCRETVIPGENGFLVPTRDVDALAETMVRFVEQPILVSTMGKRSREIAENKYDARLVNRQILEALELVPSTAAPHTGEQIKARLRT